MAVIHCMESDGKAFLTISTESRDESEALEKFLGRRKAPRRLLIKQTTTGVMGMLQDVTVEVQK